MKKTYTRQEILLFVNTRFSSRQLEGKDELDPKKKLSQIEKLEEACWNGFIWQMLPEICEFADNKSLTLWTVTEGNSFLDLLYGEFMERGEATFSVNPYLFMEDQHYN